MKHAGGWGRDDRRPEHRYLAVCGGFLSVAVERTSAEVVASFRHHGVDGALLHEERLATAVPSSPRRP